MRPVTSRTHSRSPVVRAAGCEDGYHAVVAQQPIGQHLDARRGVLRAGGVDRGAAREVDDGVAAGEARRPRGDAVGAGGRIEQPQTVFDGLRVRLPATLQSRWHGCLEDGSWVVVGGDGFAGEPVVQRPRTLHSRSQLRLRVYLRLTGAAVRDVQVSASDDDLAAAPLEGCAAAHPQAASEKQVSSNPRRAVCCNVAA